MSLLFFDYVQNLSAEQKEIEDIFSDILTAGSLSSFLDQNPILPLLVKHEKIFKENRKILKMIQLMNDGDSAFKLDFECLLKANPKRYDDIKRLLKSLVNTSFFLYKNIINQLPEDEIHQFKILYLDRMFYVNSVIKLLLLDEALPKSDYKEYVEYVKGNDEYFILAEYILKIQLDVLLGKKVKIGKELVEKLMKNIVSNYDSYFLLLKRHHEIFLLLKDKEKSKKIVDAINKLYESVSNNLDKIFKSENPQLAAKKSDFKIKLKAISRKASKDHAALMQLEEAKEVKETKEKKETKREIDIDSSPDEFEGIPFEGKEPSTLMPSSPQISVPHGTPYHIENILKDAMTDYVIEIDPDVKDIITRLNKRGYWCCVVGGYVRDKILGVQPHDSDLLTDCPKEKLQSIIDRFCYIPNPTANLFKVGKNIDIVCTKRTLRDCLVDRDITINKLVADVEGRVFDVDGTIKDLFKPYLVLEKNAAISFIESPARMTRLLRFESQLNKQIHPQELNEISLKFSLIRTVPYGVYASEICKLFKRGKARENIEKLIKRRLLPILIGGMPTSFDDDSNPFYDFLSYKMASCDSMMPQDRKLLSFYYFISLILLSDVLDKTFREVSVKVAIDHAVITFCHHYAGSFSDSEKGKFMSIVPEFLMQNYLEFYQFQIHYSQQLDYAFPEEGAFISRGMTPQYHRFVSTTELQQVIPHHHFRPQGPL